MSKRQRTAVPSPNPAPAGLKLSEIAERTRYSVGTIRLKCITGELEGYQIGPRGQWRVDPEKFEKWWAEIKRSRQPGEPNG